MIKKFDIEDLNVEIDEENERRADNSSYKRLLLKSLLNSVSAFLWFFILLLYEETIFHLWAFDSVTAYFPLKLFLCLSTAIILSLFSSFLKRK